MSAVVRSSQYALLCSLPVLFPTSGLCAGLRAAPVILFVISSLLWRVQASHEAYLRVHAPPFLLLTAPLSLVLRSRLRLPLLHYDFGEVLCPPRAPPSSSHYNCDCTIHTSRCHPYSRFKMYLKGLISCNVEPAKHHHISPSQLFCVPLKVLVSFLKPLVS
jgi:hypothetical protein